MPTLPTDFSDNISAAGTTFLGNMTPVITLILGILIGAVVIEILIGAIRHR